MPRERKVIPIVVSVAVFIALEVVSLNMLSSKARMQGIWLSGISHRFQGAVWGGTQKIGDYFRLKKINVALAEENFWLRQSLAAMGADADDAARPSEEKLAPVRGFTYIPAEVVKISRGSQHNYLIIDKGEVDGVVENSGLITSRGAVGIVDAVEKHYARAITFMNTDVSISARLGGDGAVGPLVWDGRSGDGAVLKEIPIQNQYAAGDTVYTSGFSSLFPPDIPLGITGGSKIVNGAVNEIEVTLFQSFSTLRFVTVAINSSRRELEALEKR